MMHITCSVNLKSNQVLHKLVLALVRCLLYHRVFQTFLLEDNLYLTIIPRACVGYEVIDSQRGAKRRVGYNHLISSKREGNLMDAISPVWYNGSYTIAAKPIKTLELHYTMIQFLIIYFISIHSAEKKHISFIGKGDKQ